MQFRASTNTRAQNAAETRYVRWVKESCACRACGNDAPVIAHHVKGHSFRHNKILVGHWFVIGLCMHCDRIVTHGSGKVFRMQFGPQSQLWLDSILQFTGETGEAPPSEVTDSIMDWGM